MDRRRRAVAMSAGYGEENMGTRTRDLSPSLWPQVEALFGKNGACGGCWCQAWRIERGERWGDVKGAAAKERLRRGIESGTTFGALAFDGETPIGWCTYGPRDSFPRLNRARSLRCDDSSDVWSVPCFFVLRDYRRQGVAKALLLHALGAMAHRGVDVVEGYPSAPNKDGSYIAAFSWTGTISLFEKAGFVLAGNAEGSKRRMRKALRAAR
jgi:GNAT superfamily N-acetyltransferase